MGNRTAWFVLSSLLMLATLGKLAYNQATTGSMLNLGVDYTGGASYMYKFAERPGKTAADVIGSVRETLEAADVDTEGIQEFRQSNEVRIRTDTGANEDAVTATLQRDFDQENETILQALRERYGDVEPVSQELVGPVIGEFLRRQAVLGVIIGCVLVFGYVWMRYNILSGWLFGFVGVVALVHDALFMVGVYAWLGREVEVSFVAAILTIIGYSINDTVIIFDRIRENTGRLSSGDRRNLDVLEQEIELSVWQTMARSLMTAFTTMLPLLTLFFFGGATMKQFSFALLVGILSGGYSSIFLAPPLFHTLYKREVARKAAAEPQRGRPRRERPLDSGARVRPSATRPTTVQAPARPKATPAAKPGGSPRPAPTVGEAPPTDPGETPDTDKTTKKKSSKSRGRSKRRY